MTFVSRLNFLSSLVDEDMKALSDMPSVADKSLQNNFPDPPKDEDNESDGGVELTADPTEQSVQLPADLEMLNITSGETDKDADVAKPGELNLNSEQAGPKSTQSHQTSDEPITTPVPSRSIPVNDSIQAVNASRKPIASSPPPELERGDIASPTQSYSPILAVSKYPYVFVDKRDSQNVASAIFDDNKFWNRVWDLYYVWPTDGSKALILITEDQVQTLLDDINNRFLHLGTKITDSDREKGLVARFPNHPRLTPRYLGRVNSRAEFDNMATSLPGHSHIAPGEGHAPPLDERTLEAFKQMMEDMRELAKGKNKAKREQQKQMRQMRQQNMAKQLKRAQRYLGLRPTRRDVKDPLKDADLSWEELQKAQAERKAVFHVPSHSPELPCPWPCDESVIFIAVDIEAYERDSSKITEVGVSTLDTQDLEGIAPGVNGENWLPKFRNRHFIIKDYSHLHNTEFVAGCVNAFEFGESERISLADAAQVVESCFQPPYSAPSDHPRASSHDGASNKRNVVLLGHDTGNDVRYMQKLGFNPLSLSNLLEVLDTADMFRAWKRESNPRSLGTVLLEFDIPGWNLHNAGNDARYTMQSMLAITTKEASLRGDRIVKQRDEELVQRIVEAQRAAVERAQEDNQGWSSAEEGDDGGDPVPIKVTATNAGPIHSSDRANPGGRGQGGRIGLSDRGRGNHGDGPGRSRGGSGRGRGILRSGTDQVGMQTDSMPGRGRSGRGGYAASDYGVHSEGNTMRGGIGRGRGRRASGSDPQLRGRGRGGVAEQGGW